MLGHKLVGQEGVASTPQFAINQRAKDVTPTQHKQPTPLQDISHSNSTQADRGNTTNQITLCMRGPGLEADSCPFEAKGAASAGTG